MMKEEMGPFYETWTKIKNITSQQGLIARIPYDVVPN